MVASEYAVAERAIAIAQACIEAHQGELATLADYRRDILITALKLVREWSKTEPKARRTAEHMAFALLTAAWDDTLSPQNGGGGAHGAPDA